LNLFSGGQFERHGIVAIETLVRRANHGAAGRAMTVNEFTHQCPPGMVERR
jgi:hypothetical protein